jgi:hypothetical protein
VAALTVLLAAAAVDSFAALSFATRQTLQIVALAAAAAAIGALVWRDRRVWTLRRVALWLEEHDPSIAYTLVTAVETGNASLIRRARGDAWTRTARSGAMPPR